jgi:hypothetical protein
MINIRATPTHYLKRFSSLKIANIPQNTRPTDSPNQSSK